MIKYIKLFLLKLLRFSFEIRFHYFYSEISKIKKCDVLIFCHDVDRSLTLNGLAFSPLVDTIYEEFENESIKCQAISLPWSRFGFKKTANKSLLFNRNYLVQSIKNNIFKSKNYQVYNLIFEKTQAKYVVGIGLSSDLCVAAKKYNVTTIELLHGIGYTFIPWGWDKLTSNELPCKILALDDISKKTFKPLESKGLSVIKISHPFYKKSIDPLYVPPVEWSYEKKQASKNILVTLQWGYDGEADQLNGILSNGLFYEEFEKLIEKRIDFFWHFRLHPVQLKGPRSKKAISFMKDFSRRHANVTWEKSSTVPLVSVALVCDAHITMASMSCYDVAIVGVPSLVLCPTIMDGGAYKDCFTDLVAEGYVTKRLFNPDFVEAWLDGSMKKEPRSLGICDNDAWNKLTSEIKSEVRGFDK
jgi:hypothetical protein